jgi:hypothetical protein
VCVGNSFINRREAKGINILTPHFFNAWMIAVTSLICLPTLVRGQSCTYAAVNSSCTLTLDRLNPVAPPMIYVRRNSHVTVTVGHSLPFEHVTMDLKSSVEQLPPDQLRNGFQDITAALGGLEIISGPAAGPAVAAAPAPGAVVQPPPVCPDYTIREDEIEDCQAKLKGYLKNNMQLNLKKPAPAPAPPMNLNFGTWVYSRLCWTRTLLIPIPPSGLTPVSSTHVCEDLPDSAKPPDISEAENKMGEWVDGFSKGSEERLKFPPNNLEKTIDSLDVDIADAKKLGTIQAGEYVTMNAGQQALHGAIDAAAAYQAKMQGVLEAVRAIKSDNEPSEFKITISDVHAKDDEGRREKNYEIQTWDVNVGNKLTGVAGQVKADKYGDNLTRLMVSLADAPARQTVVEFKIEFLNEPRVEVSTGLLVPFRPYHSFSEATPYSSATSSAGGCTAGTTTTPSAPTNCPVVQQSSTIAFVPNVSFNILLGHEFVLPDSQRGAWMWTIAAGYNSATTSAAFGTGLSFSYRSMIFSFVPIVDQEQHLTGGFQVNQSAGTATMPTTTYSWKVNPSIGISLRVPLGGGT